MSTVNFSSFAHSWKPVGSILLTFFGITISVKLLQVLNASFLIVVTETGSSILFKALAPWKAPSPIVSITEGSSKVTFSIDELPSNAPRCIVFIVFGMVNSFNFVLPLNAPVSMVSSFVSPKNLNSSKFGLLANASRPMVFKLELASTSTLFSLVGLKALQPISSTEAGIVSFSNPVP